LPPAASGENRPTNPPLSRITSTPALESGAARAGAHVIEPAGVAVTIAGAAPIGAVTVGAVTVAEAVPVAAVVVPAGETVLGAAAMLRSRGADEPAAEYDDPAGAAVLVPGIPDVAAGDV
jgi:hypothetical protein